MREIVIMMARGPFDACQEGIMAGVKEWWRLYLRL